MTPRRTKKLNQKRITFSEDDDGDHTPISQLINFGPVTLPEIESLGIQTLGDMRRIGWTDVCRLWAESYPERLNVNAFIGIIATLEGIVWTKISETQRSQARSLVNHLRREINLPPTRPSKKKINRK